MDITGIAKTHHAKNTATGKKSSKLSASLREKITGCGAGRLYGGQASHGRLVRGGESRYGIWPGNIEDISV